MNSIDIHKLMKIVKFMMHAQVEWLPLTNISTKIGLAIKSGGKYGQNRVGGRRQE
jgi:hypothetical protein